MPSAGLSRVAVVAREVVEEAAPRGEHARERAPVEPAAVQLRDEAADVVDLQPRERRVAGELEQRGDVARVVAAWCGRLSRRSWARCSR